MSRRGPKPLAAHIAGYRDVLRLRQDPIGLEQLPFAQNKSVQARARVQLAGRTCAVGRAAVAIVDEGLAEIAEVLGTQHKVGVLAAGLRKGVSQRAIAENELGLSEEQVSRRWAPELRRLLHEFVERKNREVDELQRNREN